MAAPPMPVPNVIITTSSKPCAAPAYRSPSKAVLAAFSSLSGRPNCVRAHATRSIDGPSSYFPLVDRMRDRSESTRPQKLNPIPLQFPRPPGVRSRSPRSVSASGGSAAAKPAWPSRGMVSQASACLPDISAQLAWRPPRSSARTLGSVISDRLHAVEFPHGVDHRHDLRNWRARLDIVNGVEHEPSFPGENLAPAQDLFAHLPRRAEWQDMLRVDAAAPEYQVAAELPFEGLGVHPGRRALYGIENVKPGFDKQRQEFRDRATRVLERLPARFPVNPLVDPAVMRHPKRSEGGGRTEGRVLRAEVRSADVHHVNQVSEPGGDAGQIRQRDLTLPFEHGVHIVAPRGRGNVPFRDVANAFGVLESDRRYLCDIAERRATERRDHRAPGVHRKAVRLLVSQSAEQPVPARRLGFNDGGHCARIRFVHAGSATPFTHEL